MTEKAEHQHWKINEWWIIMKSVLENCFYPLNRFVLIAYPTEYLVRRQRHKQSPNSFSATIYTTSFSKWPSLTLAVFFPFICNKNRPAIFVIYGCLIHVSGQRPQFAKSPSDCHFHYVPSTQSFSVHFITFEF